MIEKRAILEYLKTKDFNRSLRGYTYILDVLYQTDRLVEEDLSYDKAIKKAIEIVAVDYSVSTTCINNSIRLVFREAGISQTVRNTLRGMYYEVGGTRTEK